MFTLQDIVELLNALEVKTTEGIQLKFNKENSKEVITYSIGDKKIRNAYYAYV